MDTRFVLTYFREKEKYMALIQCPNCGASISEKAQRCVKCGFVIVPEENKYCSECGAELQEKATICEKCGCPVENSAGNANFSSSQQVQQVEVTSVKITKNNKKVLVIVAAIILTFAVIFAGIQQVQKQIELEQAIKTSEQYASNLSLAATTMILGAVNAENCGNLIKQVWYNAIYEEYDIETNKYTCPDGYFVSDFNDALDNLFSDSDFSKKIESIKSNQTTVLSLMKSLKNPPDEHKEAYEAITDFYDAYTKLTNLVVSPTGSLKTFSSSFNDADTDTSNCYSAVQLYID